MEVNAAGFAAKELVQNKSHIDQELTQQARENADITQKSQKILESRPVEQASRDKLSRIDIYV